MTEEKLAKRIITVRDLITKHQVELIKASPVPLLPERLKRCAINQCIKTPALLDCTPASFIQALSECAQYGLYPDSVAQEAHLIPFAGNVTLVVGYMGLIKLAKRPNDIRTIWAKAVYEGDKFDYEYGLNSRLVHIPAQASKRGKLRAAYAVVVYKDGYKDFKVLEDEDVLKIKKFALGNKKNIADSPWTKWEEAMWCKTALRSLCNDQPKTPEMEKLLDAESALDPNLGSAEIEIEPDIEPKEATSEPEKSPPTANDTKKPVWIEPITAAQLNKLSAQMGMLQKDFGWTAEYTKKAIGGKLGKEIVSRKDLSKIEATAIIDWLGRLINKDAEAVADLDHIFAAKEAEKPKEEKTSAENQPEMFT